MSAALMIGLVLLATACTQHEQPDVYMIRVRDREISVPEFKQAVDAAFKEAFPGQREIEPQAMNHLRVQVLNQLSEELIIMERGKDLGISVSDAEVDEALAAIKADYPDNTFEETLLENAISIEAWKKNLGVRLLIDKVITRELIDQVTLTPKDITDYYQRTNKDKTGEQDEQMVKQLRRVKAEEAYPDWIDGLRQRYTVEINQAQWKQLTGTSG